MKNLLKKVSVLDYSKFRQLAKQKCGWTERMYQERRNGRTQLTHLERIALEEIINQLIKEE